MSCYLYIVRCKNNSFYTGITWSIDKRIREHNMGLKTSIQKSKRPVRLEYYEKFDTRKEAAKREKEIKGWQKEKKEKLINSLR